MDKINIRREITVLINSIKEYSDSIANKNDISQLESELLFHKIEKLYQKSIVYNHLIGLPEVEQAAPEAKNTPAKEEVKKVNETPDKPIDLFGEEVLAASSKPKVEKPKEKKEEKLAPVNIQKPAIADITKAIGLNEKFQFANELFSGNMQEYGIAIQQLNTAESLESAMDYFSNLQQLYGWDWEHETIKRLLDLVDRRYSA